jgi:hypothetical protein
MKPGAFYDHFNSGLRYRLDGFFLLAMYLHVGSLRWAGLFAPYWGGDNLDSILFISPMADLWDHVSPPGRFVRPCIPLGRFVRSCISSSWCRNADLQLLLRVQGSWCSPWGMGYLLICLRYPDPTKDFFQLVEWIYAFPKLLFPHLYIHIYDDDGQHFKINSENCIFYFTE